MTLNFPLPAASPYLAPNGITYTYNATLGIWEGSAGGGGGGVTSVTVTAPITNTGTASIPDIGISPATPAAAGSLSAADKTKIDNLPSTIVSAITGTTPIQIGGTASIPNVTIDAATDAAPGAVELATAAEAAAGVDTDRAVTPSVSVPKVLLDMTGAAIIPGGNDTERAAITTPATGMLRYNDDAGLPAQMEYYDGVAWTDLATAGGGLSLGNFTFALPAGMLVVRNVVYGNGLFVAVGQTSTATFNNYVTSTSTDGYTWSATSPQPAPFTRIMGIAFANGEFIIGSLSETATSVDGVNWTVGASTGVHMNVRAGGNGGFVCASTASTNVYYSNDGLNWSLSAGAIGGTTGLAYGPTNEFLLAGGTTGTLGGTLYKSTDGGANFSAVATSWALNSNAVANGIVYDGPNWIISTASSGGGGSFIYTTATGSAPTKKFSICPAASQVTPIMVSINGKVFAGGLLNSANGTYTSIFGTDDSFSSAVASYQFSGEDPSCMTTDGNVLVIASRNSGLATAKIL